MKMNKKLVAMAVAAAVAVPMAAQAAGSANVSGFADVRYTVTDDPNKPSTGKHPTEGKFTAVGEVDFVGGQGPVTARVDADVMLDPSGGGNSVTLEQIFFAWAINEQVNLLGGVFNNPIGLEEEDTTDLDTINHGQIFNILDGQTALYGNNIAGVAVAGKLGMVDVTVGLLNDLAQTNEENSFALVLGGSPVQNLNVEVGYVTQASAGTSANANTAENVFDINATYGLMENASVFVEFLGAGKVVDSAYAVGGKVAFTDAFEAALRYDNVSYDVSSRKDTSTVTVAGTWKAADNLRIRAEFQSKDDPNNSGGNSDAVARSISGGDGTLFQVQFLADLP